MCMEDVRLGRDTTANPDVRVIDESSWVLIAGANEKRIALSISGQATEVSAFISQIKWDIATGWVLSPTEANLHLSLGNVGRSIQGPWYAYGVNGSLRVMVTELTLEKQ